MNNRPPEELFNNWRKGTSIWGAFCTYCDPEIMKEYPRGKDSIPIIDTTNKWAALGNGFAQLSEFLVRQSTVTEKLKKDLCNRIRRGELIAIGYKIGDKEPSEIPIHVWSPKHIHVAASSISGIGHEFVEIRIISAANLNIIDVTPAKIEPSIQKLLPPNIPVGEKKVGRQTLKEEIIFAYEFLKEHGRIDCSKALKSHTTLIQKVVQEKYGIEGTAGMQFEAIRRAVGDRFKHDRESSKKALNSN